MIEEDDEFHKFFPITKMTYLHALKDKKLMTTREIINIIPASVPSIVVRLYKYKNNRYLKHIGEEDSWIITDYGQQHYKYLAKRLNDEFNGFDGLNSWIERKRAINKIEKEKHEAEDKIKRKEYLENRKRSDEKWKKKVIESKYSRTTRKNISE